MCLVKDQGHMVTSAILCCGLNRKNEVTSCFAGQITTGHVRHFGQLLHDIVQSGLSVVHLVAKVIQHPAAERQKPCQTRQPHIQPETIPTQISYI